MFYDECDLVFSKVHTLFVWSQKGKINYWSPQSIPMDSRGQVSVSDLIHLLQTPTGEELNSEEVDVIVEAVGEIKDKNNMVELKKLMELLIDNEPEEQHLEL